jgi:CO/xanthine dehydrogenase FAD-binding subunit
MSAKTPATAMDARRDRSVKSRSANQLNPVSVIVILIRKSLRRITQIRFALKAVYRRRNRLNKGSWSKIAIQLMRLAKTEDHDPQGVRSQTSLADSQSSTNDK